MKLIPKYSNILLLTMLVSSLASCGVTKAYIKNYEGEKKANKEISLLKPVIYIVVKSINGDTSKAITPWGNFGSTDAEIAVLPGILELELGYDNLNQKSRGSIKLVYDVKPGRKYLISYTKDGYGSWAPKIIDVTNNPEQWCLLGKDCL